MRKIKQARHVRITEDLAPCIRMIFKNRLLLNVDSVCMIDDKFRYNFVNNPSIFEIRTYSDYLVKISLLPRQERSLNTYLLKSCTYITLHMSLYTPSRH